MSLITLRGVDVAFGGAPILDGVSLEIDPGERTCLLGRNGTGKSTLLGVVAGTLTPDGGDVQVPAGTRTKVSVGSKLKAAGKS